MSICDVVKFLIASVLFFENYSLFMYNVSNTKGDIERRVALAWYSVWKLSECDSLWVF